MNLSTAQKAVVKTWLDANQVGTTDDAAAAALNALVSPSFFVWNPQVNRALVSAQIIWSNYTPADSPPASPSTDMTYQNRALNCQLKQSNAFKMTEGTAVTDATVSNSRQTAKDCLLAIPSGASGANQDAGWGTAASVGVVRAIFMRTITVYEQLFVTTTTGAGNAVGDASGAATNPGLLGIGNNSLPIQGPITAQNVSDIRNGL